MRLENLYPNFGDASPEEQAAFVASYRLRRAMDLEKIPVTKKSKKSGSNIDHSLTPEEKAIMKQLGLKQKDILALRAATEEIEEVEEVSGDLFTDATFEEVEEEV